MSKVSIVVPVYGVEKYIERCAHSLFRQTYNDIEYIFVNDCTKDASIQILRKVASQYPERDVKIIEKEKNEGLPQARKTGIIHASGDYILHVDSDDWVEENLVEILIGGACDNEADMVVCNWYEEYFGKSKPFKQDAMSSEEYFRSILNFKSYAYTWNRMSKRSLYKTVDFPNLFMLEDYVITSQLVSKAKVIKFVPDILYHYSKQNSGGSMDPQKDRVNQRDKVLNILKVYKIFTQSKDIALPGYIANDMIIYMLATSLANRINYLFPEEVFKEISSLCRRIKIYRNSRFSLKIQMAVILYYCTGFNFLFRYFGFKW